MQTLLLRFHLDLIFNLMYSNNLLFPWITFKLIKTNGILHCCFLAKEIEHHADYTFGEGWSNPSSAQRILETVLAVHLANCAALRVSQ